jgi:RNA polymerase subunit RPABC4/transcription elongation factor Spt4
MLKCRDCGVEFTSSFCPKCGGAATAVGVATKQYRVCINCGQGLDDGDVFCGGCGTQTKGAELLSTSVLDAAVQSFTVQLYNQRSFDERARVVLGVLFGTTGLLGFLFPPLWAPSPVFAFAFLVFSGRVNDAKKQISEKSDQSPNTQR